MHLGFGGGGKGGQRAVGVCSSAVVVRWLDHVLVDTLRTGQVWTIQEILEQGDRMHGRYVRTHGR